MRPLNDENKLQVDKKKTKLKSLKNHKMHKITNFETIRYKMTASGNINP